MVYIPAQESSYCDRCRTEPTACRKVSETFAITVMSKGYNPVVTVPVGACFLKITERGPSKNYLALKSQRSGYILNGMWKMNSPGTYDGAGTVFRYTRADGSCPGDCIYSTGPIREDLIVQLLYHDRSPGVDYSYDIPYNFDRASYPKLNTEESERHLANDQQSPVDSPEPSGHQHTAAFAGGSELSGSHRSPSSARAATPDERSALTDSKSYYSSSKTRTTGTYQSAQSYRRRTDGETDRRSSSWRRPIFSSDFKRARHRGQRRYNPGRQSLTDTTYTRYADGSGVQERPEVSAGLDPAAYLIEVDSRPTAATGVTNEVSIHGADDYIWRIGGYSACSSSCGGGVQEPILECSEVKTGSPVSTGYCQGHIKPEMKTVACNTDPCIPNWETGQWSSCSTSCGEGQQVRSVLCQQRISATTILNVTEEECLGSKPKDTRPCSRYSCYNWVASAWSDCSVLCGTGVRTRRVQCQNDAGNVTDESACSQSKPRSSRSCDLGSCARNWYYSNWNNLCSADCGTGSMSRKVHCITDSGQVLPDDECDLGSKPSAERSCTGTQNIPCGGQWFTGAWSQCSVSCGEGIRQRQVICMQKQHDGSLHILDSSRCPESSKPLTEEICRHEHCGTVWYMTDWSKCTVTCGGGIKQRHVQCLNSQMNHSTGCSQSERPADRTPCNTERCWTRPKPNNTGCIDRYPNCAVVVQTRLCRYPYYQRNCCRACSGRV